MRERGVRRTGALTVAPADDTEARLRKLEEIAIRFDERAKVYDSLVLRMADNDKSLANLWVAVGQLKIKNAFVWSGIAVIGGIIASVVTRALGGG